ncbi:hypothetical protein U875_25340 [Pandoraea pnomenusa 3kgm]|nr:hypothetical protein U875_25340 [Pandoraea pnomenusa 3kgm]
MTSSPDAGVGAPIGLRSDATSAADACATGLADGAAAGWEGCAWASPGWTGRVSVSGFGGMSDEPSAVPATGLAVARGEAGVADVA